MGATRVCDVMIPLEEYPHVPDGCTLREAMATLENSGLSRDGRRSLPRGVLVFDERSQLLGFVRRRDMLRGLEPEFMAQTFHHPKQPYDLAVDPNLTELSFDRIASAMRERAERPVREVMQPILATVEADDLIIKAVHEMTLKDLSFIPVLRAGKVIGVVRSVELFGEIARLVL